MTGPASGVESTRAVGGVRSRRSKTTRDERPLADTRRAASAADRRSGSCRCRRRSRRFRRGRDARGDSPPPTSAASGAPGASAMRPSRLVAAFRTTNGRRSRISVKNGRFSAHGGLARDSPTSTATPRDRRKAKPRPLHGGIRILDRRHDAHDARVDDPADARAGAALVAARLERAIQRRAAGARRRPPPARAPRRAARRRARGIPARRRRRPPRRRRRRRADWGWCARCRARRERARAPSCARRRASQLA